MAERSVVELPPEVGEPFEVFLNGVPSGPDATSSRAAARD
jgi:hypothetical protein